MLYGYDYMGNGKTLLEVLQRWGCLGGWDKERCDKKWRY